MAEPRPRPLVGAHGYTVDVHGAVYGPSGRRMAEQCLPPGRLWITSKYQGQAVNVPLAPAVLETFVGPPPTGERVVVFLDGDPSHCALRNLRWLRAGEDRDALVTQRTAAAWLEAEHA